LLIHFLCSHTNLSFLHFVHLRYPSNGAPKRGGARLQAPSPNPKTEIKKTVCKDYDIKCRLWFTLQLKSADD
jgi:hypothetical protein